MPSNTSSRPSSTPPLQPLPPAPPSDHGVKALATLWPTLHPCTLRTQIRPNSVWTSTPWSGKCPRYSHCTQFSARPVVSISLDVLQIDPLEAKSRLTARRCPWPKTKLTTADVKTLLGPELYLHRPRWDRRGHRDIASQTLEDLMQMAVSALEICQVEGPKIIFLGWSDFSTKSEAPGVVAAGWGMEPFSPMLATEQTNSSRMINQSRYGSFFEARSMVHWN